MRAVAISVLMMLMLQSSQQRSEPITRNPKPKNEEQNLKDILYKMQNKLVELQTQMKYMEKENKDMKVKLVRQLKQNKVTTAELESVNKELLAQSAEVKLMKGSLSESLLEVKKLSEENKGLKKRIDANEINLKKLKKDFPGKLKVAFSAGLTSSAGPSSSQMVLAYSKVFSNIGKAYNPTTGSFTAPIAGVYSFQFTVCGSSLGHYSGVMLYKNQERLTSLIEYNMDGYERHFSGGLTVQLDKGDIVNLHLPSNYKLHEDSYTRNIFSGFLLFPSKP